MIDISRAPRPGWPPHSSLAAPAGAADWSAGSAGLGDPFFPQAGNGGYDVRHYSLDLDYDPPRRTLDGTARDPRARRRRTSTRFDLDLRDFFDGLARDGRRAPGRAFQQRRPGAADHAAAEARTRAAPYTVERRLRRRARGRRRPRRARSRAGSRRPTAPSWSTSRRARRAGSRPTTTRATRRRTTSRSRCPRGTPRSATAAARPSATTAGKTTWRWREDSPMATYLATATNGDFDLSTARPRTACRSTTRRSTAARPRAQKATATPRAARSSRQIIAVLHQTLGPYPFDERRRDRRRRAPTSATRSSRRPSRCTTGVPSEVDARARARAPVVRRQRDADGVARHLAQRGLRDLVGVAVAASAPAGRRRRPGSTRRYATPAERRRSGQSPPARPGRPRDLFAGAGLRPRRDDAAGAPRQGRRRRRSSRSCARGTPRTATAT